MRRDLHDERVAAVNERLRQPPTSTTGTISPIPLENFPPPAPPEHQQPVRVGSIKEFEEAFGTANEGRASVFASGFGEPWVADFRPLWKRALLGLERLFVNLLYWFGVR